MAKLTVTQGLREYADWLEKHSEVRADDAQISHYGESTEQAALLFKSGAKLDALPNSDSIVYLTQSFGELTVKHVVAKEKVMEPAIVAGKITWKLRPEFALSGVANG